MATTHVDDLNATEVNPDLILTPESVRIKCEEIKRELKVQYARSNLYKLKNSVQNMLPSYVNKICTLKNYNLFENDDKSHSSMAKNRKLNHSEANEIVNHYSKLFIESIVILNDCWFAITSFDVFVHHNKKIDDCADDSKIAYQAKPIAYIRRKNKFKTDYFELSIRLGELESLVTGGFRGQLNDAKNTIVPFLGSSIPNLPDSLIGIAISPSTPSVFVLLKEHQDTPIFTNRTVNQFLKDHSMNRWAIHSSRFHKDGFYPANPVYFKSRSIYHEASSLLLRMYAEKRVILGELDEMLKEIKDRGQKPNSNTTKKIVSLLEFTRSRFSEVTHIRLNSVELSKKREELIEIFNSSLYKALKA